nr:zinc finger domain-containing protein [endosymbiont of Lamellibrachia barhami]
MIYGKTGEHCPNCGNTIKKRTIGQRSSYYCAHCQR